ncbi:hypothetical protein Tco_0725037 [Tanacetum coccineum]|uniref:Integrase, catalytic region, zinc finger, CCHC-type, peptidase aspartic, catalytic n=1 Tax=Tanacetum coccineum TaxID=301880 RepID=A0ABQ4YCT4_9ASTR
MANLSEYIQCASFDTQPPMLDRTDFASWQQCIRLYCRGKENGVNILKSIDEGPFQMGTFWETLAEGNEGLPKDIYTLINHNTDAKDIWDNVKMLLEGSELTNEESESQLYDDFEHFCHNKGETIHDYYVRFTKLINDMRNIKMTMPRMQLNSKFVNNMLPEWGRFVTAVKLNKGLRDSNYDQLYAYLKQHKAHANENKITTSSNTRNQATVQDGMVVVQNVQGHQNRGQGNNARGTGHITRNYTQPKRPQNSEYFKDKMLLMQAQENGVALDEEQLLFIAGRQDNVIDDDVDEQPVQDLALNVDNVFQADDCDAFDSDVDEAPTAQTMFMENLLSAVLDVVCEHHEVHEMHDDVQPNHVVDSHVDYTSDSNMIPYDQYVKDNAVSVVQSNVSSVPNDAYMMIINEMHEQSAQNAFANTQNKVVNASLTAELATYKEQVELYERRAKFELTEREQKIEEQLRIVITDRNIKEENLKKELHSVKMQLSSTINHNKSMVEEVTSLKKDFKQKENKYLEEFLDMKALKEKVEDKLYKQDQSLQTVHMLLHNSKDTLEIAEITRNKIYDKMKDPECVKNKVKIAPHDYSKENYLATFTPQKQLTSEQIFWSKDLLKMKAEALKEQTIASRPIKALTVYPPNTPAMLVPMLEAEVDQNVVNRKHDEIERKNLLIANDNLIADCLSKEVFYIATNFELTVSRFTEMHDAHTVVEARCLELEAELSKLHDKVQKDDHNELVKRFSNLKITRAKHIEQTTTLLTENENLKAQIHENLKCITRDSIKPKVLAPGRYAIDVEPIPPRNRNNREVHYLKHLKESVETLREIVEEAKVERALDRSLASACL